MRELEIHLPAGLDLKQAEQSLEAVCRAAGLRVTLKDKLARYPGSIHWHFKRGDDTGTLELTLWPAQQRAWFSVQSRRNAPWIDDLLPTLKAHLERTLSR